MKIGILGTGAYGFGLATAIRENKHDIIMWTAFEKEMESIYPKRTGLWRQGRRFCYSSECNIDF